MKANHALRSLSDDKSGYIKVVGGLVALLLMIIVGILVFWTVSDNITFNNAQANASKLKTTTMASTIFSLLPIIALAVVASIIIGVIIGFGGGEKGM